MNVFIKRFFIGLSLLSAAGIASAQDSCSVILQNYFSLPSFQQDIRENHPECFGTADQSVVVFSSQAGAISKALASRQGAGGPTGLAMADSLKGIAAGNAGGKWNVWGSVNQNDTDFSYTTNAGGWERGATEVQNMVVGLDLQLSEKLILGVSVAMDDGDAWARNTLNGNFKTKSSTDGYTIAPYLGYQISKEFAFDASVGMGEGDFSSPGLKADADRWFAAANLTYNRWVNNWQFSGKLSYLHGDEDYGNRKVNGVKLAGTGTNSSIDQLSLGVQAGYWMNGFMPYAGLAYIADAHRGGFASDSQLGRDAWLWSLGANFYSLSSKVTGGVSYQQESGRDNADNRVLAANVNFRF